jgi:dephospho-CoA kinase
MLKILMARTLVVGLTGSIGAGKTALAALLAERGIPVIDADAEGRAALEAVGVRDDLLNAFGPAILAADGRVDRSKLADIAFSSPAAVARLNKHTQPALLARVNKALRRLHGAPIVVIDAALIVEWQKALPVDVIVVVEAESRARRRRARGKYAAADFGAREKSQLSADEKRAAADIIVTNDGPRDELERKAAALDDILNRLATGETLSQKPLTL